MLPNRSRPFPARENLVLSDMWSITEKESDLNGIEFNVRLWNSLQQCKWYLKCKSTAKSLLQLKVVRFVSLGDWILTFFDSNVKVIDLGKFSPNTRGLLLPGGFPPEKRMVVFFIGCKGVTWVGTLFHTALHYLSWKQMCLCHWSERCLKLEGQSCPASKGVPTPFK